MSKQLRPLSKTDFNKINFLNNFYEKIKPVFYQNRGKNYASWSTTEQNKKRYFPCIPSFEPATFLFIIRKNFPKNLNFLDVGCGYGHIVALASAMGFIAKGIEYGKKELFEDKIPSNDYNLSFSTDAFDLKENFYNSFSVIFFYQPINDMELCNKLYKHVIDNSKKNTVFIVLGNPYLFAKYTKQLNFITDLFYYPAAFYIKE